MFLELTGGLCQKQFKLLVIECINIHECSVSTDHPCFTLSHMMLFTYMKMNLDRLSFVKTSHPCFDVTYLYL